ncbi:hypothetical protein SUGI_0133960 [Cryptomeria japonica]|nr:hypothetical protein SUGI_0133960 [Cryptomeria japonica]
MAIHVAEVDQNILFRAGQSLAEFPESASATSVRISVMYNRIRILPESVDCAKLVTLLLSWNTFEEVPESFLEKLNMLKVLYPSNTPIKFLPNSIHQLKYLLYLHLSNTQIKVIPHQTFELIRLQFLDLSFSPMKNIASMIKKLKSLQTLNLAHCYDLEFVSCDISQLTSLEELDSWKSTMFGNSRDVRVGGESREASLQDVCKLHRLKHLRLALKSQIEEKTMGNLVELQGLWLLWMPEVRQTYLPTDMRAMHSLERAHLYNCHIKGTPDLFPELQNLTYLKDEIFSNTAHSFWIRMLPSLESLCSSVEEGALPMLQTLTIFRCMKVKVLPQGLDNLKSLEQIRGEKEWWNEISWRNEEMKNHFHAKYMEILEIHDNYHV